MEIRALSLRVTEAELNDWLTRLLVHQEKVRALTLAVSGGKVSLTGTADYLKMEIPFEAGLEVQALAGLVALRIASFQAAGFFPVPASLILNKLQEYENEWFRIEEDTLLLDVTRLLESRGMTLTASLSAVVCEEGALLLEAQAPAHVTAA